MEIALAKFVFMFFLCSFIFASEGEDPIQKICSNARNPNNCFQLFKGESGKSLIELAKKAITQAGISSVDTNTLLTTLTKGTTDPTMKGKYEACSTDYIWLMRNLDRAAQSIGNSKAMGDFTLGAIIEVDDCVRRLGGSPVTPPKLNDKIEEIRNLCSIILIISAI